MNISGQKYALDIFFLNLGAFFQRDKKDGLIINIII